jgi:hypothetical protein
VCCAGRARGGSRRQVNLHAASRRLGARSAGLNGVGLQSQRGHVRPGDRVDDAQVGTPEAGTAIGKLRCGR